MQRGSDGSQDDMWQPEAEILDLACRDDGDLEMLYDNLAAHWCGGFGAALIATDEAGTSTESGMPESCLLEDSCVAKENSGGYPATHQPQRAVALDLEEACCSLWCALWGWAPTSSALAS